MPAAWKKCLPISHPAQAGCWLGGGYLRQGGRLEAAEFEWESDPINVPYTHLRVAQRTQNSSGTGFDCAHTAIRAVADAALHAKGWRTRTRKPSYHPTARLETRISPNLQQMPKRAAEIPGRTLADFVVTAVQEVAQRAIEQAEVIRLSLADQPHFADVLLSPPAPSPALQRAMARHDKLLRSESPRCRT